MGPIGIVGILLCGALAQPADDAGDIGLRDLILLSVPENAALASGNDFSVEGASKELRARFEKKVSFEFVDTPLREALDFLSSLGDVTIVLMPAAEASAETPITLRVDGMPLRHALGWVARLAGLPACVVDEAVAVGVRDENVYLRVYDVRDFAQPPDFPGPDIVLGGLEGPGAQLVVP
jgi:hypothetical protein